MHGKILHSPRAHRINRRAISQISVKFKALYRLPFEVVNVSSSRIDSELISAFEIASAGHNRYVQLSRPWSCEALMHHHSCLEDPSMKSLSPALVDVSYFDAQMNRNQADLEYESRLNRRLSYPGFVTFSVAH